MKFSKTVQQFPNFSVPQTKLKDAELQLEGVMNLLYLTVDNATAIGKNRTALPATVQKSLLSKIEFTNHSVQVLYNVSSFLICITY